MWKCITSSWMGIWIHACGGRRKRPCAMSTHILEFRLGGVHARIGTTRSLRSTLISYNKQLSLQGCFANQFQINDRPIAPANRSMHVYEVRPRKDHRSFDLISDVLPFGKLWYTTI